MSTEHRKRLDELGFVWDVSDANWEEGFSYLKCYKERVGDCRVPISHKEDGFRLGVWVRSLRQRKNRLSTAHREQLNALGFVWDPHGKDWEEGFRYLKSYKEREGHCRVPQDYKENGYRLAAWVSSQRHNTALPEVRRQRLDKFGFVWDPHGKDWEEGFSYLIAFKKREGHCRVPSKHKEHGFLLGRWVVFQRIKENTLPKERRQLLDNLGFIWKIR